ncbi:MAG: NADH:flavin oxidoreductase, partial [Proteobacteria bacterium]
MSLLDPVSFRGGATIKNRIALAALTNRQSHADGTFSEEETDWLVARARGGFGLVTTCATYVSQEGKAWAGELGLANETHHSG